MLRRVARRAQLEKNKWAKLVSLQLAAVDHSDACLESGIPRACTLAQSFERNKKEFAHPNRTDFYAKCNMDQPP